MQERYCIHTSSSSPHNLTAAIAADKFVSRSSS